MLLSYFLINTNSTVEDAKAFCIWPTNKLVVLTLHSRFDKLRPNVYLEIYNTNSAKYLTRFVNSKSPADDCVGKLT